MDGPTVLDVKTRAALAITAAGLAGCAVQTYAGPRRPSQQVAVIETDGTRLTGVDGWRGRGSKLEVLPGMHALAIKLDDTRRYGSAGGGGYRYFSKQSLIVCFVARPGHTYLARPVYAGRLWTPEIVDESIAEVIRASVLDSPGARCAPRDATADAE